MTQNKDAFFTGLASGAGGASVLARRPVASSLAVKK